MLYLYSKLSHLTLLLALCLFSLWCSRVYANTQPETFESNSYSYRISATPDWVTQVPFNLQTTNDLNGAASRYMVYDMQTKRPATQPQIDYTHIVVSPLNQTGLEDASEIEISFNPEYQILELHQITLYRNGQAMNKLIPDNIKLLQQEKELEYRMLDGRVSAYIILDDVKLNDIIEYKYSIIGQNPVYSQHFFERFPLAWGVSVEKLYSKVIAPKNLKLTEYHYQSDLKIQKKIQGSEQVLEWSQNNTPTLEFEDQTPKWFLVTPFIQISEFNSWQQVKSWAQSIYPSGDLALTPEVLTLIKEWNKQPEAQKIQLALQYVQDKIRYLGVEIGINSHKPNAPIDVLTKRRGDCKDKSLLLVTLLAKMGIKAYPALVSSYIQQGVKDFSPSPGAFDHVIVMVEQGGQRYWLDPTMTYQAGELGYRSVGSFGYALLLGDHPSTDLVKINEQYLQTPHMQILEVFTPTDFSEKSDVALTVTTTYDYQYAESYRNYFANTPKREIEKKFINFYAQYYPNIRQTKVLTFKDDKVKNQMTITEHYVINDFWEFGKNDKETLFYVTKGHMLASYTKKPEILHRVSPLGQVYPLKVSHEIEINYPQAISPSIDEQHFELSNPALNYQRDFIFEPQRDFARFNLEFKQDYVAVNDMPEYLAQLDKINDDLHFNYGVRPQAIKQLRSIDYLRFRLKQLNVKFHRQAQHSTAKAVAP